MLPRDHMGPPGGAAPWAHGTLWFGGSRWTWTSAGACEYVQAWVQAGREAQCIRMHVHMDTSWGGAMLTWDAVGSCRHMDADGAMAA